MYVPYPRLAIARNWEGGGGGGGGISLGTKVAAGERSPGVCTCFTFVHSSGGHDNNQLVRKSCKVDLT